MIEKTPSYRFSRYLFAWAVHAFTASAACIAILTLIKIYEHQYVQALWLMAIAVVIDSVDGSFARLVGVKMVLPRIDGTLLDNMVDYLNYVITPCFFLFVHPTLLPVSWSIVVIMAIAITSAYQFCQADAKTPDHFFKGFPCYWNIVIFYMFLFNTSMYNNVIVLLFLCFLIFVPIKYLYPSRLDYLTKSFSLKVLMHLLSLTYGIASAGMLWTYPAINPIFLPFSLVYIVLYLGLSLYRTCHPMNITLSQSSEKCNECPKNPLDLPAKSS